MPISDSLSIPVSPAKQRLRARPGDPDEQRLVEASNRGHAYSANQLSNWFGGYRFDELGPQADTTRASLLTVTQELLDALASESAVDHDLVHGDLRFPRMKVTGRPSGNTNPAVDGLVRDPNDETDIVQSRSFRLQQVLAEGATLVVNHFSPRGGREIAELTNHLSRVTATAVQTNVYISEREAIGFGRHWDDHDVLIIQCRGKKYWEIFHPAALSPMLEYVSQSACGESVWSGILEPGSALFIPRGWPHEVSGFVGELSIHYTMGIRRFTGYDLLAWLANRDSWTELSAWVSSAEGSRSLDSIHIDSAALEHGLAMWRGAMPAVPWVGPIELDQAFSEDLAGWEIIPALVGGAVLGLPDDDHLVLYANGNPFSFSRDAVEIVARFLEGGPTTVEELRDLAPMVDGSAVIDIVREFGRWDLLQVVKP